jgi:hypothetical protein
MRLAYPVRNTPRPELEFSLSVVLSVREIVDALYLGKAQKELISATGPAFRLRTSFR